MDALRNLTNNIPVWQRRLDELSSQIDKRQIELAQLAETKPNKSAEVRSLRNKGSTESLKPTDDGPMHMDLDHSAQPLKKTAAAPAPPILAAPDLSADAADAAHTAAHHDQQQQHPHHHHDSSHLYQNASSTDMTPQSHPRPTSPGTCANEANCTGDARLTKPTPQPMPSPTTTTAAAAAAAAAVAAARCPPPRTKKRTASVASVDGLNDGKPFRPTSITRSMLIVYYDSYVQGFFDDMVRFISSSRNLMRKAKMAAKVAQIKRLAEMESPSSDGQTDEKAPFETLPSLRFINSRQLGSSGLRYGLPGAKSGPPDVYDDLDKALEFVQSTCEHGAHQFLRDANCNEELKKIQKRMDEVLETAKKEAERIVREEPELAKETTEQYKPRTRRPITMSRNLVGGHKDDRGPGADGHVRLEIADFVRNCPMLPSGGRIEVDLAVNSLVVKAGADTTVDVDPTLPRMPLSQDASSGSMRHQQIIAAE